MSDIPDPDTPQLDIPVPHRLTGRCLFPTEPDPEEEPDLLPPEPPEPPGDDVPKVGQQPRQQRDPQTC